MRICESTDGVESEIVPNRENLLSARKYRRQLYTGKCGAGQYGLQREGR